MNEYNDLKKAVPLQKLIFEVFKECNIETFRKPSEVVTNV